jgi:hypothetical protein
MPRLSTDDDVWRIKHVWLGPEDMTLPFQLRYTTWAVGLVLLPAGAFLASLVMSWPNAIWWGGWAGVAATWAVMRHVNHDRSAPTIIRAVARELRRPGAPAEAKASTYTVRRRVPYVDRPGPGVWSMLRRVRRLPVFQSATRTTRSGRQASGLAPRVVPSVSVSGLSLRSRSAPSVAADVNPSARPADLLALRVPEWRDNGRSREAEQIDRMWDELRAKPGMG